MVAALAYQESRIDQGMRSPGRGHRGDADFTEHGR